MSTLITVKQVKSLTVGFAFPETYDMSRAEEIKVYLGKNVYPHTIDGRVVKCQIKSDDTAVMYGANRLSFWLDDSIIGVYPVYCGDIVFEYTNAIEHNESVNTGFDLLVNLAISETAITVDNVLYNYFKGNKGDTGKYGETKFVINDNMELEQHTLIGDPLNFSLVDDDLVLTEGGETVNLGTVVYKNPNVIDMRAGEYLMDIINAINALPEAEKPTVENPLTINFYNHSKTIDWSRYTEKIHWPRHVYLNFVGKINPWPNVYNPGMGFHEGLLSSNPTDKLFLGFSFDRTNDDSAIKVSGLPENVQKVFFGGLDQSYQIAGYYQNLIDNPEDWGEAEFGLVRVNGSKDDDVRNDALYKKINGVFVDVTPDFRYVDFSGCDLELSYFYSANNQGANFDSANNQGANFDSANNQGADFSSANNQWADFSSANNQGANFYSANNQWAHFSSANNQGADFSSANNQGANFYSANNQGAYFYSANNQNANFSFANNQGANFYSANNQGANFQYSNNQGANFVNSNLKQANWNNVVSIANANFQDADLTGGTNLPERINTKAKWIAECGAINVNAQTIWIDGTSILS